MLNSAILLWMVHKDSEIWQISPFYEILRDKIQDKEIYLFSFWRKNTQILLFDNIAVFSRDLSKKSHSQILWLCLQTSGKIGTWLLIRIQKAIIVVADKF